MVPYSPEQLAAIKPMTESLSSPTAAGIGALVGWPGTGKTSIAKEIMSRWAESYGRANIIALSPTGKASRRFIEVTGFTCMTVHKALVEWEDRSSYGSSIRNLKAVLVDESSMVDQYLAERLLGVLPPTVERLLFVGDADQLPSVGPGCVLRDMMASGVVPVWRLTKIYRNSEHSWIRENASRINKGERPFVDPDSEDYHEVLCESHEDVQQAVMKLMREHPNAQVLVPGRRFAIGAIALNDIVRETVNPSAGRGGWKAGDITFHRMDRVIHKKNNYAIGVMNGEVGTCVGLDKQRLDGKEHVFLVVDYGDRKVRYPSDVAAKELRLAFALTVHSSQGSEYEEVIVVIHSSHSFLLNRQLIYTALTRARKRCWIVGEDKAIALAVKRNQTRQRKTLLAKQILSKCAELESELER